MQRVSLDRANLPQTALVIVATVAAIGVLGATAAYWARTWFAARPPLSTPAAVEADGASAVNLFGQAEQSVGIAPNRAAIRLVGVVAPADGQAGYALIQLDTGEFVAARAGEEVMPGVRLAEVRTDSAIIERDGNRETLVWPEKAAADGDVSPVEDTGSRS